MKNRGIFLSMVAPIRQVGLIRSLEFAAVVGGVIALTFNSIPHRLPIESMLLSLVLWLCLGFFVAIVISDFLSARRAGRQAEYWSSGLRWIDALTILPVPVALAVGLPSSEAWLFGVLWLLRIASAAPGLGRLGRVIVMEARPLTSALIVFVMVLFFAAVILHLLEGADQPRAFGSLPRSLWWAVVTLTTTGYGDATPHSDLGRFVAALVMICGLGVFGLVTGILATGFVEDSRRDNFVQNWNLVQRVPFFRCLDPAGVIELSRMLRRWDVGEGTTVIRRGNEGDCMYFVASGEVEVDVEPPVRLGPGSFFGELAILGNGVRNASVTTTMPTTLLILELAEFRTFTAHHPALAEAIEAEAARRAGNGRASANVERLKTSARVE
jgi:voltage-gated potassium channel